MRAFLLCLYGTVQMQTTALEAGYELILRATRLADEVGDAGLRATVRITLGWALFLLGRCGEAADVAEELGRITDEDRAAGRGVVAVSPYGWSQMARALFAAHCGGVDRELVALEQAIDLLKKEGDAEFHAMGHRNWAVVADLAGWDPDAALEHAHLALEWAEQAGGPWARIFNREGLAISHAYRGEWLRAIRVVDEALVIQRERRIALANVPLLLTTRVRAEIGLGDLAGARRSAEEAVTVAVRCGTRFYEAQARHQLARALLAGPSPGREEAAKAELDQALAICDALGLRAYEPHLHYTRAELALAVGDQAAYYNELRTAHRLFLDVGATGHARRLETELTTRPLR